MKKITVLAINFIFLLSNNIQASFLKQFNPYSFGPEGRTVADLRDFAKPNQMADILSGRPVAATNSDGTRVYYTSDGKMCMSIKQDGTSTFSVGGISKERDAKGNLTKTITAIRGENLSEIKNEHGEVLGYIKNNGDGKPLLEYDEDMNVIRKYSYSEFGSRLESSLETMTNKTTFYDEYGRDKYVVDEDGYILTSYQYKDVAYEASDDRKTLIEIQKNDTSIDNDRNKLKIPVTSKDYKNVLSNFSDGQVDVSMTYSTTYYDEEGLPLHVDIDNGGFADLYVYYTKGKDGNDEIKIISKEDYAALSDSEKGNAVVLDHITTTVYNYETDTVGNRKVLMSVKDTLTKQETFYEDGRQTYTINDKGNIIAKHYWDGTKFLFTATLSADGSGSITVSTKDNVVNSNIYYNDDGTINSVLDSITGNIIEKYHYTKNNNGDSILSYVEKLDNNGNVEATTYYDGEGHSTHTVDKNGDTKTDYNWNKSDLVYSFDRNTKVTTWHTREGEAKIEYETFDNRLISKKIYMSGQLIGLWTVKQGYSDEVKKGELTVYVNELQRVNIVFNEEPSANFVDKIKSDCIKYKNDLSKLGEIYK